MGASRASALTTSSLSSSPAEGGAPHDLEQPGPRQGRIAQLLAVLPGVGKTVLHHVFGDVTRARQRPGAAQQEAVMVPHPLVVAGLGRLEQHGDQERTALRFIPSPSSVLTLRLGITARACHPAMEIRLPNPR